MKEAGREMARALLARVGAGQVPSPGAAVLPGDPVADPLPTPLMGVERRLVRRAEILWNDLRGEALMPDAGDAAPLLSPPFLPQAVLMVFASREVASAARGNPPAVAEILYVGESVRALDMIRTGAVTVGAGASAGLAARFAALGAEALHAGTVARYDSDDARSAPGADSSRLLMRAVALPLSTTDGNRAVIVIANWRRLLSAGETAALHHELAETFRGMAKEKG